jgi:hypothetical protein
MDDTGCRTLQVIEGIRAECGLHDVELDEHTFAGDSAEREDECG